MTARALGPHARWWARLDDRCRTVVLACRNRDELPADVWGTCLASAQAEGLIELDGWLDDVTRRRLPFAAAMYLETIRCARPTTNSPGARAAQGETVEVPVTVS